MNSQEPTKRVGKAVLEALARGAPNVDLASLPNLTDLSADTLTDNVIAINSLTENPRQRFVNESLVKHLHSFVREVGLTTDEWMSAVEFLTAVGQTCTDLRQEFILLSDIFGVSAMVDVINHPKPPGATESTVLGPFFVEDAKTIENGQSIASEGKGEYMLCRGRVTDSKGDGIPGCIIETWETDEDGYYDTQYDGRTEADCRGRLVTGDDGCYTFRCILPVAYPIPNDGPVGKLLRSMNRHVFRPAHLHMMFQAEGYEELITSLYFKGDPYLQSDAVFGVKSSLIVEVDKVEDPHAAKEAGFRHAPFHLMTRDFVLITSEEADEERRRTQRIVVQPR